TAADCGAFGAGASNWTISVAIAANAGNGIPTSLAGFVFNMVPNVDDAVGGGVGVPVATSKGAIDWACTSTTNVASTGRALSNNAVPATDPIPAKYMPSECR